jgi:flavin reductase
MVFDTSRGKTISCEGDGGSTAKCRQVQPARRRPVSNSIHRSLDAEQQDRKQRRMNQQPIISPHHTAQQEGSSTVKAKSDFRDAMSKLAAAVNIITTDGPAGKAGFAATAVCSVSDSPSLMLVCLNRSSSAYSAVTGNGVICINVLAAAHEPISRLFGGRTPVEERFASATWTGMTTGAPALEGALASIDCRIRSVSDGGSHDILVCDVQAIRQQTDGKPLLYFNRQYHML